MFHTLANGMTAVKKHKKKAPQVSLIRRGVKFVHESEARFARILDFYQVEWQYEPTTFPLRWSESQQPIECFSPDFYLPTFDTYIEVTTCRQRLITKKKRKIRLLKELYPDIRIRLIQNKDFHHLMWKYGISS